MYSNLDSFRFLVIGSNSFSGSHFVKGLINRGCQVWGISRSKEPNKIFLPYYWKDQKSYSFCDSCKEFKFQSLDLNKDINKIINLIDEIQPEYIVNFAAQGMVAESWKNPVHWYQTNIISQVSLHDELRKRKFLKKYVHVTTPEVYGSTDNGWMKESFNFSPSTPYAVSRAACDLHLMSFYKAYDFPVVFTRAANVYGPGQQLYRIIPRTILSALTKKGMNLHGGGKSERSFIYIKDVVDATIELALSAECGTSWHISTKEAISIKDLVNKICKRTNVQFDEIVNINEERLGKDLNYLLDSNKIRNTFNWKESFSLDEGITLTLNWLETNLDTLKNLPWEYIHQS